MTTQPTSRPVVAHLGTMKFDLEHEMLKASRGVPQAVRTIAQWLDTDQGKADQAEAHRVEALVAQVKAEEEARLQTARTQRTQRWQATQRRERGHADGTRGATGVGQGLSRFRAANRPQPQAQA